MAVATVFGLAVAPVAAAPKPPPNPTNSQLAQASIAKSLTAHLVGVLSAQVAQAQAEKQSLAARAELAEQRFALAESKLQAAKVAATQAKAAVVAAQHTITKARQNLTSYVHDSYVSPPVGSTTIGMLTASDPSALLQAGIYQQYISAHNLDAMGALDRATIAKSNADANARTTEKNQQRLADQALAAQQEAQRAYAAKQQQTAHLQQMQTLWQTQLAAAQLQLATLNNQRATYVAYQRQQAAIAAAKARAAALARQRAAEAAAAAAARNQANNSSSGSVQSAGGGGGYVPPGPSGGGGWTASKGQQAANKALSQLGVRYSWAAGGWFGPSYGVDSPGTDGWNDHTVFGFDCSGLTMFAWYSAAQMPHFAASQYYAGSFHPQPGQFMPGDLLFWSDGGADAIHHVAMYIGGGNVVQAPNSGDVVRVTPWDQVSYGYFGATRPLT
ncbi:MAG: C40 family peptidase [Jatrophihabitantaceae bacterium]